jgi:ferritin-like metal-binding protein YciE
MSKLDSLNTLLVEELRDLYDAEQQLTRALPKMAKAATTPELREAFEEHLQITEQHVSRLEESLQALESNGRGKKCKGMQGLIEEGQEHVDADGDEDVIDAALIGAAQKVEHYEISAYGTAREHATCLGHTEIADLLQQTLDEERETDRKLSALAEDLVNRQAVGGSMEDDDELDDEDEESSDELAKPAPKGAKPKGTTRGRSRS